MPWGTVHTIEYGHIIGNVKPLNRLWNIGPFPAPGTTQSVAKMQWIGDGYEVEHGASMRLLIDCATYGKENGTWFILPTGNSGDVMSGHFDDQADMYLRGEYRSLRIEDDDVERHRKHKMHLTPSGM
ncbi:MAG: penicillin acylase family protein [Candidatus Hydrogenedentes bacterium]|nr:penicillin acylase family protein [Candidatus Hydrogenedentota bacterium]